MGEMHLLFIDESGIIAKPNAQNTHFVLGGVIIPVSIWEKLADDLAAIKKEYAVEGEIKWRYFAPRNKDKENSMLHLSMQQRDEMRFKLYDTLNKSNGVRIIYNICNLIEEYQNHTKRSISNPFEEVVYHFSYARVLYKFQIYLRARYDYWGENSHGLIVCDHRNKHEDESLRLFHKKSNKILGKTGIAKRTIIESILFTPSHHSVGVQFADIVAGAIHLKYNSGNEIFYNSIKKKIITYWNYNQDVGLEKQFSKPMIQDIVPT